MSRPAVSVVMPFAGDAAAARAALDALRGIRVRPGDELILADNVGIAPATPGVRIVAARGERSPAHARNAGARRAGGEWILFVDADTDIPAGLIDAYFAHPVPDDVGALAGEVVPAGEPDTVAARYGAERNFLGQSAHLAHPFRPRAAAANLLVRRTAFEQLGGFLEGLRAAEDTDFAWRLQEAGWRLELAPDATVGHRYRTRLRDLRRQWRGYAAGRAWLGRRYPGFAPEPAVRRALRRDARRSGRQVAPPPGTPRTATRVQRATFLALDAVLSVEELAGFALSNRPAGAAAGAAAQAVLVAERFPATGDPLVELARALGRVRVEAAARPRALDLAALHELAVVYREDDGRLAQLLAAVGLAIAHPVRVLRDLVVRGPGEPSLRALAPVVRRLQRDAVPRVLALGTGPARATAARVAALAGRPLGEPAESPR